MYYLLRRMICWRQCINIDAFSSENLNNLGFIQIQTYLILWHVMCAYCSCTGIDGGECGIFPVSQSTGTEHIMSFWQTSTSGTPSSSISFKTPWIRATVSMVEWSLSVTFHSQGIYFAPFWEGGGAFVVEGKPVTTLQRNRNQVWFYWGGVEFGR